MATQWCVAKARYHCCEQLHNARGGTHGVGSVRCSAEVSRPNHLESSSVTYISFEPMELTGEITPGELAASK